MNESYTGGCLCGAVRYQASGEPFHISHCHCTLCRRTSGAAFVTWLSFKTRHFHFTTGEAAHYASTPQALRGFCARCGTALTFQDHAAPEDIDVTVCSLDRPESVTPRDHIWTRSRLPWIDLADGLPAYERERNEGG